MATEEELIRNNDDCAICWDSMAAARKLPCGHLFHKYGFFFTLYLYCSVKPAKNNRPVTLTQSSVESGFLSIWYVYGHVHFANYFVVGSVWFGPVIPLLTLYLNSSSIDELGNWCLKGWMGAWAPQALQGGIHGNPASRNHCCMQPPTGTVILKEFSGKYSPDPILTNTQTPPKKGRGGLGARIHKDSL